MSDKMERVARAMAFATRCRFDVSEDAAEFWAHTSDDKKRDWLKASRAAIAALEPVSVQEAAIMVADHIDQDMNAANQMIDKFTNISLQMPARHWLSQCLRALAEKDDTP